MKRMKTSVFLGIWVTALVVVLALGIAVNLMATVFSNVFISLFSWERGATEVVQAEGTEDWDANYYSYEASSLADATSRANKVVEEICDEGFVLMKNADKALPLDASKDKVALLGRGGVDPILGGSGSGNTAGAKTLVKPYDSLKEAGFKLDEDVYSFFKENYADYDKCGIVMDNFDKSTFFIGEIPVSEYTFTPKAEETAVVFIARGGGEGWDLSPDLKAWTSTKASQERIAKNFHTAAEVARYADGQHQLELSAEEKDMIGYANAHYAKTIVVINSSHAMELGDLAAGSGDLAADAILWVGSPGAEGFRSLGKILSGAVNPSGRTVDIYAADFTAAPAFRNNGIFKYEGLTADDVAKGTQDNSAYMLEYEEGIYVGYKYYETADAEAKKGRYASFDYDKEVVYPFGYGLSYDTDFQQSIANFASGGDEISVAVSVKNNGARDGKSVVQLYYTPPYTNGGIEKSAVNLIAAAKVAVAKGETETVKLTFAKEDLASYDDLKLKTENGGYVLEGGEYEISLRSDSHTVLDTRKFVQNGDRIYTDGRATAALPAVNRFDDVSTRLKTTKTPGCALRFSRSDFAGTFPTTPTSADLQASLTVAMQQNGGTTIKAGLAKFDVNNDPTLGNVASSKVYAAAKPATDAKNGTKLVDLRGKAYDDPAWEMLLANIAVSELAKETFNSSAYNTAAMESIDKPRTSDPDGPAGISSLFGQTGCCAYMSEVILASTFNAALAEKMGRAVGEEAYYYKKSADKATGGTSGWYAPAMNIHRTPFGGRNFEYYSEDGVLSGVMGAAVVRGASSKGVNCYIKHFALNESEIWRTNNMCIWAGEQAIREIYLKPFELSIKNSEIELKYIADSSGTTATKTVRGAFAIMSSFSRLGTTWAGGHYGLMTEVLRGEWGFEGVALSDFNLYEYMPADQGIRAGTDIQISMFALPFADESSATALSVMRGAAHHMCYAVVHTNIMQGATPGATFVYHFAGWQIAFIVLAIVMYIAVAAGAGWVVFRMIGKKKAA